MPIFYGPSTYFSDREPVTLELDTTNPNALVATYDNSRNLSKIRIVSLAIEDPNNSPNILAESSVNILFPGVAEGDEGIIEITNVEGDTQLNLDLFQANNPVVGDFQIKKPGVSVLRFVYFGSTFHFVQLGEVAKSATENREITLNVRHGGDDGIGSPYNDFATPNGALAWTMKNARFAADIQAFSTDSPKNSVTINIWNDENSTPFEDTIHLPDMPNIGIHIVGKNNSLGDKPIIDASGQPSQFERGLFSRNSRYITIENISLKNDKSLIVVTRYSDIRLIDCTLECTDTVNPRSFILSTISSSLIIAGRLEIISASNTGGTFLEASTRSSIQLRNVVGTHTGNRNAGLSIITSSPIKFDQILEAGTFSIIEIDNYLDGSSDGVEGYVSGSIFSDNPTMKQGFNGYIENNSVKFP